MNPFVIIVENSIKTFEKKYIFSIQGYGLTPANDQYFDAKRVYVYFHSKQRPEYTYYIGSTGLFIGE